MRILAFAFFLALFSCSGSSSSSDAESTADQEAADSVEAAGEAAERSPEAPAPDEPQAFEETFSEGKVQFTITSPNSTQGNTLTVAPSGLEQRNDTMSFNIQGLATDARMADLNQDGFPEVYVFVKNVGEQPSSAIYGFASYRNRSYGPINVQEPPADMLEGYQGDDEFTLEGTALKRSFPVYENMGTEAERLAGQQVITYELKKGEAAFVLEPTGSEMKE